VGGRSGSSGMTSASSSGNRDVQDVFGMSASTAARNYWDNLRISTNEKYDQAEDAARGEMLGFHQYDVIRTQAGGNNPDLLYGTGRNATWKENYNRTINERLGESGQSALRSAIQSEAQAWLDRNPRPQNPRKNGYRWNGTRYVKE